MDRRISGKGGNDREGQPPNRQYACAIYARLSVDGGREEKDSIESQIEIARAFLESQPDMALFGCYCDLGKSGRDFNREEFRRMMKDVQAGLVGCIIVKDLSRLGRNYIETGTLMGKIFPLLGVRLIAVTDGFDSFYQQGDGLGTNLKNLVNEMYARDISNKIKNARRIQREGGSYMGGPPPYGYLAGREAGRRRLWVDAAAAGMVREIYRRYDEGETLGELAKWLYKKGVHRPSRSRSYGSIFCRKGEELLAWSRETLKALLSNPVYLGSLGRAEEAREQTHQAIIEREMFQRVARRLEEEKRKAPVRVKTFPGKSAFEKVLFCGDCGHPLSKASPGGKKPGERGYCGYFCRNSYLIDGRRCQKKYISGRELEGLVKTALKWEASGTGQGIGRHLQGAQAMGGALREKNLQRLQNKIAGELRRESEQYRKYRAGEIDREAFRRRMGREEEKMECLKGQREGLLENTGRKEEMNQRLAALLVERIELFGDKRIKIEFRFRAAGMPPGTKH